MNAETNTFNGNNGGMLKVSLVYMVVGFVVFLLMGLAVALARLVEVEMRPPELVIKASPVAAMPTPAMIGPESGVQEPS